MGANTSEPTRALVRARHNVRLVRSEEEGSAAADLPPGVYGFTGSPGLAAPLFADRRYRNFEIHHRHDGSVAIVGFVTPAEAAQLRNAREPITLTIYPDVEGVASEIVAVAYDDILQHRQYSIRNAPGLEARVRPTGPELAPASV